MACCGYLWRCGSTYRPSNQGQGLSYYHSPGSSLDRGRSRPSRMCLFRLRSACVRQGKGCGSSTPRKSPSSLCGVVRLVHTSIVFKVVMRALSSCAQCSRTSCRHAKARLEHSVSTSSMAISWHRRYQVLHWTMDELGMNRDNPWQPCLALVLKFSTTTRYSVPTSYQGRYFEAQEMERRSKHGRYYYLTAMVICEVRSTPSTSRYQFFWEGIRATRHASDMIARRTSIACTVSRQTCVDMRCAPSQTQSSSQMLLVRPCLEEQILSGDEGSQSASKKGNG